MKTDMAYSIIRTLGAIFADALKAAGKEKPDVSDLVHGIAAYNKLGIEGEDANVDEAYKIVTADMVNAVRAEWKAMQ